MIRLVTLTSLAALTACAAPSSNPSNPSYLGELTPAAVPPLETPADEGATEAEAEAPAKQLANPIASLISVPLQLNHDTDIGPDDDGERTVLNVQPVIPFSLGEDWNLITRTIVPIVTQDDVLPGSSDQSV